METLQTRNIHARMNATIKLIALAFDSDNTLALKLSVQPGLNLGSQTTQTTVSVGNAGDFTYTFTGNKLENIRFTAVKDKNQIFTDVPRGKYGTVKKLYLEAMKLKKL